MCVGRRFWIFGRRSIDVVRAAEIWRIADGEIECVVGLTTHEFEAVAVVHFAGGCGHIRKS